MSLESEVQENTRTMKEMLGQMRGGFSGGGSTSAGSASTSGLGVAAGALKDTFFGAAGAVETFIGKLVRNQATIPDLGNVVTSTISPMFGGVSKLLGDAFGGTVRFLDESARNWQDFSRLGPTMYGNMMNLNTVVSQSRVTYDEYAEIMKNFNGQQLAFGRSMTEGAFLFSNAVDYLAKSDYQKNIQQLGIKEKERAEIMATVIRGWTGLNLSTAEGMEKAAKAVDGLAKSMAAAAEVTGVSRDKQLENMREVKDDLRLQAQKEEKIMNGDYNFAKLSEDLAESLKTAPAAIRDAALQASSNNGQVYGRANDTLNLLAPQTLGEIRELGTIISDSSKSMEERERAAKTLAEAQQRMTAEVMTNSTRMFTKYDTLSEDQKKALKEIQPFREGVLNVIAQSKGTISLQDAINMVLNTGKLNASGTNTQAGPNAPGGMKPGEVDPGRESTALYLNISNRLKDVGNVTVQTIDSVNRELSKTGKWIERMNRDPMISSGKTITDLLEGWLKNNKTSLKPEEVLPNVAGIVQKQIEGASDRAKPAEDNAKARGGSSVPGAPYLQFEEGMEFKADATAKRIFNNGETKTMLASMQDGMRMFPILSSQLQKVAPEVAQVVSNAVAETMGNSVNAGGQDLLIEEIKKLNSTMMAVAGFNKATVDGINKTTRAIESTNSVYS